MEPSYKEGDNVLCYEPMLGRARVLYEAKVTGVPKRRTREPVYRLSIHDWNKVYDDRGKKTSYDHDVPESFLCKVNERHRRLMHKLTRAAAEVDNETERAKVVSRLIIEAFNMGYIRQLPPGIEMDDSTLDSPDDSLTLNEVKKSFIVAEEDSDKYLVEIELDESLKRILENDCSQIKTKGKIPSSNVRTVIEVLEAFMRHHANQLLFERPKHIKDTYKAEQRISLTKEVLEGIRCLFDTIISVNLLYNEELFVHDLLMSGKDVGQTRDGTPRRRQTRSSTAETPLSESPSQSALYSTPSEIFKTTSATQQLLGKLEQHTDSQTEGPSSKKPRLAPHLQSNIQNTTSGRSTPTHNVQAELLMKEINEWRLVTQQTLNEQAELLTPLPSSKYGAIHLLRLFVQLPDILTRMRLGDEWRSFLLSVFNYLLSYLLEERGSLFDNVTYTTAPAKESSA